MKKLTLAAVVMLAGCGSSDDAGAPAVDAVDVRVEPPAADAQFLQFLAPEIVVPVGSERMYCIHMGYDGEETAFSDVESLQGKYGHHAILMGAKTPLPAGTVEDCTNGEDMAKYEGYAIPIALPEGHGVYLPAGKKMVLQVHYVNSNSKPIRTRDIVRLKKRAISDVKVWTSVFATNTIAMKQPPRQQTTFTFDCNLPVDGDLLLLGGHMHEWGKKIEISIGPSADKLKTEYSTDWRIEYRDAPPINMMVETPLKLTKGMIVRTSCTWNNDTDQDLTFPKEMCASFGYIAGQKDAVTCRHGEAL